MSYKLACEKRQKRKLSRKDTSHRRILSQKSEGSREVQLHATKGYRSYRK